MGADLSWQVSRPAFPINQRRISFSCCMTLVIFVVEARWYAGRTLYAAMVKFAKQLELQLVPEWRGAYCQYKLLKKSLNKIKQNPLDSLDGPKLSSNSESPLQLGQSCRKSFWSHIDLIQVSYWYYFLHYRRFQTLIWIQLTWVRIHFCYNVFYRRCI